MKNFVDYGNVYAEVIEVLNYISLEDYEKIPIKYITFLEENCNENSTFTYNIALPFEKQNISEEAKNILGMIFRLFIINQEKIDELNKKDREKFLKEKNMNKIKYNTNSLLKNKEKSKEYIKTSNKIKKQIIKHEESVLKRVWNKILNIIKKS